jgi:ssDNA-binding Zn-finger/Zn-ribbon topoisomerase 1
MEIVKFEKDNQEFIVVNRKEDCPVCGTPLESTYGTWNMLHGEMSFSCCKSPYQIKDYWINEETHSPELVEFVKNIGKDGNYLLSIKAEWIEPLRKAIEETGIKNINDDEVFELAKKYKEEM